MTDKNYKLHNCAIHCYWLEQAKLKQEKAKTVELQAGLNEAGLYKIKEIII